MVVVISTLPVILRQQLAQGSLLVGYRRVLGSECVLNETAAAVRVRGADFDG